MRLRVLASAALIVATTSPACTSVDAPAGLYVSTCDPSATLEFTSDNMVIAKRNLCEGYFSEESEFELEDDVLTIGDIATFVVTSDEVLTLEDEGTLTCGNCGPGDTWKLE